MLRAPEANEVAATSAWFAAFERDPDEPASSEADHHGIDLQLRVGKSWYTLPPWFTARRQLLPSGLNRSCEVAFVHYLNGSSLLVLVGVVAWIGSAVVGVPTLGGLGVLLLLIVGSVLIHELGHVVAYRLLVGKDAPAIVEVAGLSCGLIRLRPTAGRDAIIVLAGPFSPLLGCLIVSPLGTSYPIVTLTCLFIAIGHIAGLLLPTGDGAAIRELLRVPRRVT